MDEGLAEGRSRKSPTIRRHSPRGEASPDDGDCLAMSFSVKVAPQPKQEEFRQESWPDSELAWLK